MTTSQEVFDRAGADRAFYASLLANPRQALEDSGFDLTSDEDIQRVEQFVQAGQAHMAVAARLVGAQAAMRNNDWGIGAGCCSSKVFEA